MHRQNTIYKNMPEILETLKQTIGEERLNILTTVNPDLAIHNKRIDILEPIPVELTLKEKIMMFLKK